MRNYNKIALACCSAAFGLFALTGCEGGEIFEVNAPDWVSDKVQEIEDEKNNNKEDIVLEGMMEDVYTIGNTDYSSGWWTSFSKYYVIPDGQKWNAVFNLNINPSASNTFKNFALMICTDANRDSGEYKEYGAMRFDNQPSGNSEWGDYIDRSYIQSTLTFETDADAGIEKLGGKVILTIDRTNPEAFNITMTNGVVTKTYKQPSALVNLNADTDNTNIRCFMIPEGSYIDFLQTNIEPIGGCTSAADKNPVSMVLQNVPETVDAGTSLEDAVAGVTAVVTFEEGVTKTVKAEELNFSAIPDMDVPGKKTLVAVYSKTFKGENCEKPVIANAEFELVEKIISIEITTEPSRTTYYYYTSEATSSLEDRTLAFDTTGMIVKATAENGSQRVLDNSKLSFSAIPATIGEHIVTISVGEDVSTTLTVNVSESTTEEVTISKTTVGQRDNTTGFKGDFSDYFSVGIGETKSTKFKNYSDLAANWNNFIVSLCKQDKTTEYVFVRPDNWGTGTGYDACIHAGTQGDWATWLPGMNGAMVTVFVTNCGNGTADVQIVMEGTTAQKSTQYYLGINTIDPEDLFFTLSVDHSHIVFGE